VNFTPQRNVHVDGILAVTQAARRQYAGRAGAARLAATHTIAHHVGYVGVLCVEFFLVDDGSADGALVVNEMAPRPHNSGHYTMDACDVSQFDLQVHAMAGLPLRGAAPALAAIMLNLLGDVWLDAQGNARTPDWQASAGPARHAPAPLWQDRSARRPQDGPPQHHRRRHRRRQGHGAPGGGHPGAARP
jgi:5-(carboxyamino)imidazole ribonucleotide synthase